MTSVKDINEACDLLLDEWKKLTPKQKAVWDARWIQGREMWDEQRFAYAVLSGDMSSSDTALTAYHLYLRDCLSQVITDLGRNAQLEDATLAVIRSWRKLPTLEKDKWYARAAVLARQRLLNDRLQTLKSKER